MRQIGEVRFPSSAHVIGNREESGTQAWSAQFAARFPDAYCTNHDIPSFSDFPRIAISAASEQI
jgi:hypothetical protein